MKGFVSYSHDDQRACAELRKHLQPLARAFGIDFLTDHHNQTGQYFDAKIRKAIEISSLHVILISHNLLWSDFIMETELPLIRAKERDKGDLVMGIVLDECAWELVAGSLIVSPRDEELRLLPIRRWRPQNRGFDIARQQMQRAIEAHFNISARLIGGAA